MIVNAYIQTEVDHAQSSKWGSFFSHFWEDFSKISLFSSSLRQHVLDVVLPRAYSTSFVSFGCYAQQFGAFCDGNF